MDRRLKGLRKRKVSLFRGYLHGCLNSIEDAEGTDDYGSLRSVHFWKLKEEDAANTPDYSDPLTIAYYQLRYASGYAFEYYCAYRLAMAWLKVNGVSDSSAVSLGCGSGLDRYSMWLAAIDAEPADAPQMKHVYFDVNAGGHWIGDERHWLGIDIATWGLPAKVRCAGFPAYDNVVKVLDNGAVEYFEDIANGGRACTRNIFFFPRILSELDDDVLGALAQSIRKVTFARDQFVVCVANRAAIETGELAKSQKVLDAFAAQGFEAVSSMPDDVIQTLELEGDAHVVTTGHDGLAPCYAIKDGQGSARIGELGIEGFSWNGGREYLFEGNGGMSELHKKCPDRATGCMQSCKDVETRNGRLVCPLSVNPVSTTSQMNLQIVMFERR